MKIHDDKVNTLAQELVHRRFHKDTKLMAKYMISGDEVLGLVIDDIKKGDNYNMMQVFSCMGVDSANANYVPSEASKIFKQSYQKLKDAVIATSNDRRLEKTIAEQALTLTKEISRFVANIMVISLNLAGESINAVGKLIHIIPVAAQFINRMPILSKKITFDEKYALEEDGDKSQSGQIYSHKNVIERIGHAIQDIARVIGDKANPVNAAFSEADKIAMKYKLDGAGINYGGKSEKPDRAEIASKKRFL